MNVFVILSRDSDWSVFSDFSGVAATFEQAKATAIDGMTSVHDRRTGRVWTAEWSKVDPASRPHDAEYHGDAIVNRWMGYAIDPEDGEQYADPFVHIVEIDTTKPWWRRRE